MHSPSAGNLSVSAQKACETNSPSDSKYPTVNSFPTNTPFSTSSLAQAARTDFCPDAPPELKASVLGNITKSCDPFKNHGLTGELFLQVDSETGEDKVYKQGRNGVSGEARTP